MQEQLAKKIVAALRDAGINFMAYLPETRLSQILRVMEMDKNFRLLGVANEAEAISIAAGATLGGKQSACYMEGSGVYVSAYNLLAIGRRMGVPILLIVAYYGSFGDQRNSFLYALPGTHLIRQLEALDIEYLQVENGERLEMKVKDAVRMMNALKLPVALLFTGEFTL
jgi:sulfopyruvate decarboxylase TPP-binding subunit